MSGSVAKTEIDAANFPVHNLRMARKSDAGKVLTVQKTLNTNLHKAKAAKKGEF